MRAYASVVTRNEASRWARWGWTAALGLGAPIVLFVAGAFCVLGRMRHVVTVENAADLPLDGFRLAFDNRDFHRDAPSIEPEGKFVFDFDEPAETGYVFSRIRDGRRVETGRCGYTDGNCNVYKVRVSGTAAERFECSQLTPPLHYTLLRCP